MIKHILGGIAAYAILIASSGAIAQSVKHQAKLVDQHVSSLMRSAEITTHSIGEMFVKGGLSDAEFHGFLNSLLPMMPEVRAIVVMDANGVIAHDSFRLPAINLDLSERDYFVGARGQRDGALYIGKVTKGKTSGLPFLPISRAFYDGSRFAGVVSLVVTPNNLLRHGQWQECQYCYVEVLRGDLTMLAQHPSGVDRPDGYFEDIQLDENSASGRVNGVRFHEVRADVSWIRNERYPLITVYMDVKPNSEVKIN